MSIAGWTMRPPASTHSPGLDDTLAELFDARETHIQRVDLGNPVSVVTLGAEQWDLVQRAHDGQRSFLETEAGSGHCPLTAS